MEVLTPPGLAGIAVLRVSPSERDRVHAMLQPANGGPIELRAAMPPTRAALAIDGVVIDDVLVIDRGARGLELHLHGSAAVLNTLCRVLGATGTPPCSPAERLLRHALSVEQLQLGLEQQAFDFAGWLTSLDPLPREGRLAELERAAERSRRSMALANPQRLLLVGRQNAGKSSLFNRLLARERVVTGPTPGLTRDPIAESTTLAGYPYELVDTAGHGPAASEVDTAAMQRGTEVGGIQMLVVDAAKGPGAEDLRLLPHCSLVVANKCDLTAAAWPAQVPRHLQVTCMHGDPAATREAVGRLLHTFRRLPAPGAVGGPAALTTTQWQHLQSRLASVRAASG